MYVFPGFHNGFSVIRQRIRSEVAILNSKFNLYPKITVIEVGHLNESALYIEHKRKFALQCGIELTHVKLPSHCTRASLLEVVHRFNVDPTVHGIMLQLPFDSVNNLDVTCPLHAIVANKDVEGLGFINTALLSRENVLCPDCESLKHHRVHIPCTAAACFAFIRHVNFPLKGAHCVVIGRGRLVGAPTADLLVGPGCATVTQCHVHSRNLAEEISRADLVVAGTGCPELIKGEWIKPGALVLDCGYTVVPDPQDPSKTRSVGDVQFEEACNRAGWITPVPGGVGPVNIAMLFRNTVNSARWTVGLDSMVCCCTSVDCQPVVYENERLGDEHFFSP
ncbi:Bifunctional protein FolD [Paragonimus heterotremus]|uniref:C-1-tetrahydrofolate synthase, cytoplasmic n=1 Tax=Paragonimus heterotremus TaxID=100268 RepID=A0A8J4WSH4_9TREM|nr:Bifunctional protein FolD [Paragonimus heterotremus]